jgi:hypothetical protein
MRTTLTLDEDVAAKLKSEARRSGHSFRRAVNEALRRGLAQPKPFNVVTRDPGETRPGISLDDIGELLDRIEKSGPLLKPR